MKINRNEVIRQEVEKVTRRASRLKPHTCSFKDVGRGWLLCKCGLFKWDTDIKRSKK
jgi:hypothetical protein